MGFGLLIKGMDKIQADIKKLGDTTKLKQVLLAGALKIESDAKLLIQHSSPTGVTYRHGNVLHIASSPGEAPSTDTGRLVSSIQHWTSSDGLSIAVGSQVDYATYLEFGTRYMQPRPFLGPAIDMNRAEIIANIKKALKP
jgi:HK97 gp10 family phage protein